MKIVLYVDLGMIEDRASEGINVGTRVSNFTGTFTLKLEYATRLNHNSQAYTEKKCDVIANGADIG